MLIIGARKGGVKCSSACPWYTETGRVRSMDGSTHLGTHCRMTMHPWMVDCDQFDPMHIDTLEVTEDQWLAMQKAVKKKAKRQRKLYPEEHEEIHHVGEPLSRPSGTLSPKGARGHAEGEEKWTDKGKWNREKSGEVVVKKYRKKEV